MRTAVQEKVHLPHTKKVLTGIPCHACEGTGMNVQTNLPCAPCHGLGQF